jgi:arabinose-5-phosphate isomerase
VSKLTAAEIMSNNPKVIEEGELAVKALELMRNNNITQLLAVSDGKYSGVIHLHDLLKEGII